MEMIWSQSNSIIGIRIKEKNIPLSYFNINDSYIIFERYVECGGIKHLIVEIM